MHHSDYSRNVKSKSLTEIISTKKNFPLFPIHRLDGKTTGVLLFAKNKESLKSFQVLFQDEKPLKTYIAILRGYSPDYLIIDKPIGPPKSEKQRIEIEKRKYKPAFTKLSTLAKASFDFDIPPYSSARYSLVEFNPITGRTHQLRNHANHISHPIIGDHKYGDRKHNKYFNSVLLSDDMFLHASKIQFAHPITGLSVEIQDKVPKSWKKNIVYEELLRLC